MGYKLGIDFGTTNSLVAYVENEQLNAFHYPDPESGKEYIPSCIAYENNGDISIGSAVMSLTQMQGIILYKNFKMYLPMSDSDLKQYNWPNHRSPEDVITDYLHQILCNDNKESGSFKSQGKDIEGLVVSIPHVWHKDMSNMGREKLSRIICDRLGLNLIQLVSEPVAAAAFYAYNYYNEKKTYFQGNLLVCDMGGGTFDVTLCKVSPQKVEEIYNYGNGLEGIGQAGVAFDTYLITKCLKKYGVNIQENTLEFYKAYFELQFNKSSRHSRISSKIITCMNDKDLKKRDIIPIGNKWFNYEDISEAFSIVDEGIKKVLNKVKTELDKNKLNVDTIYVVGGFSQFVLVRESIKKYFGIGVNDPRYSEEKDREKARFAIGYGAALVANNMWQVEERYMHTIGVVAKEHKKTNQKSTMQILDVYCPIIEGGKKVSEYDKPIFLDKKIGFYEDNVKVTIYVEPDSKGKRYTNELPHDIEIPNRAIPGNQWRIGMRINKSLIAYLIIEDTIEKKRLEIEIGDLIKKMFSGIHIISKEED